MKLFATKDYDEMSLKGASVLGAVIAQNPKAVIGLATGSTPVGTYKNLAKANEQGIIDFSDITSVNLDEYVGLPGDHDQSYRYFMNDNLFNHVNIDIKRTHVPNGLASDVDKEGLAYDEMIKSLGGTDIQLLGIGANGHIAFNEPDDVFTYATHKVTLTENTREVNARFFASIDDVPKYAITMGIGSIFAAKKILLLANGANKAQALYDTVYGPISPKVPASILQLHTDVTIVADEAAMAVIREKTGFKGNYLEK